MDMGIDASGCHDQTFASQRFCGCANSHARCHAVHDIRISSFSDSFDLTIFDSDISLDDSCRIHDQGICNNKIQISVFAAGLNGLSHSVTDRLAASEFHFIAVCCIVFFYLDHKACICQTYLISRCGSVHRSIFAS